MFPPLVNCKDTLSCIVAKLMPSDYHEEMEHSKIITIGILSRLDLTSVDKLPIWNPKITHASTVIQEYKTLIEERESEDTES